MSAVAAGSRSGRVVRFLSGRAEVDFIGRSRRWALVSLALVVMSLGGLGLRGLNFGIDFTGGTVFVVTDATRDFTAEQVRDALGDLGVEEVQAQVVEDGRGLRVSTPGVDEIGGSRQRTVLDRVAAITGVDPARVDSSAVGPRWGAEVSGRALRGLGVFLVLVVAYITVRFELRMAVAALVTLLHDVLVTVGVYAIVGFQVSPASVIAFLTILGYSLYDTVVVFDRVREDTASLSSTSTATYGEAANRALNHVLVRSLSTSVTSLLPVGSLLFVGANLLGADTLSDLALALFVGMAVGTYSSIFLATPFLVWLKERESRYAELRARVLSRRGGAAQGRA
ncbi:MAG: protein translocase subunit SecF [Actinomycetota bacterium]|nr:protein translocase subunit SecF [Actinomycetota bacterium]